MSYSVYIDECGQNPYFNDQDQPVISITGVAVKNQECILEEGIESIFNEYNIPKETEIHANEIFSKSENYEHLSPQRKQKFVFELISFGIKHIEFHSSVSALKPFIKPKIREQLNRRNLDPYLFSLFHFVIGLDVIFHKELCDSYSLFFDKVNTKEFRKRTLRMIQELRLKNDKFYYLQKFSGKISQIDSKKNRYIQFADLFGYIYSRNKQFEIKTFKKSDNLSKYEEFYKICYNILKKKLIDPFVIMMELIGKGETEIYEKCGFDKRDFNHILGWLTRKKNIDIFDYQVNSRWIRQNKEQEQRNSRLIKILSSPYLPEKYRKLWIRIFKINIEEMLRLNEYIFSEMPDYIRTYDIVKMFSRNEIRYKKKLQKNIIVNPNKAINVKIFVILMKLTLSSIDLNMNRIVQSINKTIDEILKYPKKSLNLEMDKSKIMMKLDLFESAYSELNSQISPIVKQLYLLLDIFRELVIEITESKLIISKSFEKDIKSLNKAVEESEIIIDSLLSNLNALKITLNYHRNVCPEAGNLKELLDGIRKKLTYFRIDLYDYKKRFYSN